MGVDTGLSSQFCNARFWKLVSTRYGKKRYKSISYINKKKKKKKKKNIKKKKKKKKKKLYLEG